LDLGTDTESQKVSVQKNKMDMPGEVADQGVIDNLIGMVTPEMMQTQMAPILMPIIKRLSATGNPDEARAALIAAFPEMDSAALEQMLTNLIFISDVWGCLNG
jgi:phage gp29-like protein